VPADRYLCLIVCQDFAWWKEVEKGNNESDRCFHDGLMSHHHDIYPYYHAVSLCLSVILLLARQWISQLIIDRRRMERIKRISTLACFTEFLSYGLRDNLLLQHRPLVIPYTKPYKVTIPGQSTRSRTGYLILLFKWIVFGYLLCRSVIRLEEQSMWQGFWRYTLNSENEWQRLFGVQVHIMQSKEHSEV
jgi:hypothetical protein